MIVNGIALVISGVLAKAYIQNELLLKPGFPLERVPIRGINLAAAPPAASGSSNNQQHQAAVASPTKGATNQQHAAPPQPAVKGGSSRSQPAPASKDNSKRPKKPTKTHKQIDDENDDNNNNNDDDDDDDGMGGMGEEAEEAEKEYMRRVKADKDAGLLPGRMKMIVPPRTIHTPLFELDSVVELQWEYDQNVLEVPEKLMISVQLPKDPHANPGSKPMLYDIAANITGNKKRFFWDTKNDVPDGVGMQEGSGYIMYFYDGDIGFRMSDVVPAGYLIKYAMPFAFYISRYDRTNDGVPRGYNPNAASRADTRETVWVVVAAATLFWFVWSI